METPISSLIASHALAIVATLIAAGCTVDEVCPTGSVKESEQCRLESVDVVFPEVGQGSLPADVDGTDDSAGGDVTEDGDAVDDTVAPEPDVSNDTAQAEETRAPPPDEGATDSDGRDGDASDPGADSGNATGADDA